MRRKCAFYRHLQGRIGFNTVNPSLYTEKDFPMHSLGMMKRMAVLHQNLGAIGRTTPLPSRFPSTLWSREISWASGKIMMTDLASSSFSSCFLPTSSSCFQESTWFKSNLTLRKASTMWIVVKLLMVYPLCGGSSSVLDYMTQLRKTLTNLRKLGWKDQIAFWWAKYGTHDVYEKKDHQRWE